MPNQPHAETVTVSFTLPRALADAVAQHALENLTNKSDIIRRALLRYIPAEEAEKIMREWIGEGEAPAPAAKKPKPKTKTKTKK
jgi:hypothetical protein